MTRRRRLTLLALGVLLLLSTGLLAFVLFFPTGAIKSQLESRLTESTGYRIQIEDLKLGLAGFGLALSLKDVRAESGDGSQTLMAPDLKAGVDLWPLLSQKVSVNRVDGTGAVLTMGPRVRSVSPGGRTEAGSGQRGTFIAPKIRLTGCRIIHRGDAGTTRLEGVSLSASFDAVADKGHMEGSFKADSTLFAPATTPEKLLRLPEIDLKFKTEIDWSPLSASTSLEGRFGAWPARGTVKSLSEETGMKNLGDVVFESVDVEVLKTFLAGETARRLEGYALGGRLDQATYRFETFSDASAMDFEFKGRWSEAAASLPGKGNVISGGDVSLLLKPDDLVLEGNLELGSSRLDGRVHLTEFKAPRWEAELGLEGPAEDALRFLPPESRFETTAGRVDLDVRSRGIVGRKGLPEMNGNIRLSGLAFRHPSLAVPVERLDVLVGLAQETLVLTEGYVDLGGSEARFSGEIADFQKPEIRVTVNASTLDLGRLFPEAPAETPPAAGAATKERTALPVSGRLTVDRLIRDNLTLTQVAADFSINEAGLTLDDVTGTAYGGRVLGRLNLKPAGPSTWDYSGRFQVTDAETAELLSAVTPITGIEGRLQSDFSLAGKNGPGVNVLSALTLDGVGTVLDGAMVNIPLVRKLAEALQIDPGAGEKIVFRTLRHHVRVEGGFARIDTLRLSQSMGDWTVAGKVGLDGRLDCPVVASLSPEIFAAGSEIRKLADLLANPDGRILLGLSLGGTLKEPTIDVDLKPLLEQAKEKGKESLGEEIRKRLDRFRKRN